jgi:glutamate N-acetyltransferase/amino-acid N-acetyltransferase
MASGQAGNEPISLQRPQAFEQFVDTLTDLCTQLAKLIARDGEGATKLIEVRIRGAASSSEAELAAKTVATSPLIKTALFGNDPNWGRALAAIGRSGIEVDPERVSLWLGPFQLVEAGEPLDFDVTAAQEWLSGAEEVVLETDLDRGQAEARVWTCDLSYKYVEINAEYHT